MLEPSSAHMLQQIAATARAGRLDAAALMVEQARINGVMDPVIAALGGAIEFQRGQFSRAVPLLVQAQAFLTKDITVRANLAESYFHLGDHVSALALCDEISVTNDASMRLARLGGHLAQEAEEYVRSIMFYRMVAKAQPNDWSIWNNLGNALSAAGEAHEAAIALEHSVRLAADSAPIRINLGNALIQAGRNDDAQRVLLEAAAAFADDPNPYLSLYNMYRDLGREDDAYDAVREAARRAPNSAPIQSDLGQEAARRNDYAIAEAAFEAALVIEPALGPAFVGLAAVYERMNREAELEPLRERATHAQIDEQSRAFIDALSFKRANEFDAAFEALERAGDVVVPGRKLHLRGIMLDRLGRHDEAFEAFSDMNTHWKADPSQPAVRAREYRDGVTHATELLSPSWIKSWAPLNGPLDRRTPIFLVGFPRSGTTLLDTMLMADPSVRVLEEEAFIGEIENELGGIDALPNLTESQIITAREGYFDRVRKLVGLEPETVVVDKHPMHLTKVAVIRRLFPEAKFVLAMRHPCDVVLSCFITNFRINNAMANFLDLEDTATLYDLAFSHWEKARSHFDLSVSTVIYEQLVEDPEDVLKPVFDELGLIWPSAKFDHRNAARARGTVSTASYSQVTEPIYKRAAGRWTRYREQLEPIIPVLAPWVKRFGYEL
jgi:tetratricopeptide (TPR) repeat protein